MTRNFLVVLEFFSIANRKALRIFRVDYWMLQCLLSVLRGKGIYV